MNLFKKLQCERKKKKFQLKIYSNNQILYHEITQKYFRCRRGRDRMVVELQLPMQSVPITTDVVTLNLDQGEVYNSM